MAVNNLYTGIADTLKRSMNKVGIRFRPQQHFGVERLPGFTLYDSKEFVLKVIHVRGKKTKKVNGCVRTETVNMFIFAELTLCKYCYI